MQITTYRDARAVYVERLEESLARYNERKATPEYRSLVRIARNRLTRIIAGSAGTLMGGLMFAVSMLNATREFRNEGNGSPTILLVASWLVFGASFLLLPVIGLAFVWFLNRAERHSSGDLVADAERIARTDPLNVVHRYLRKVEWLSVALPASFLALILPLTLHLVCFAVVSGAEFNEFFVRAFDGWIAWSGILVGIAHGYLAYAATRYARSLAQTSTHEIAVSRAPWGTTLLCVVGAGTVPGILAFAIPPLIVAATGLIVVPVLLLWMRRTVLAERKLAEMTEVA